MFEVMSTVLELELFDVHCLPHDCINQVPNLLYVFLAVALAGTQPLLQLSTTCCLRR